MSEIFFTSDTHFSHEKIIGYCGRPFENVDEMDEHLIKQWNSVVKNSDWVYHLGDFAFKNHANVRRRLNGTICLIEGNHDDGKNYNFHWIKDLYTAKIGDQKIVLCHYALRTWHHDLKGNWHLFGHSHGGLKPYGKSTDIGVDVWNFAPVSFEQVKKFMDRQEVADHPRF